MNTEGNDINVLYGSIGLLSSHLVRALEFEVHEVGHWGVSRLDNVIALLHKLGMVRYWHLNGDHPTLKATRCMSEAYETPTIKSWSNMVCVNQNENWRLAHVLGLVRTNDECNANNPGKCLSCIASNPVILPFLRNIYVVLGLLQFNGHKSFYLQM